MVCHCIPQIYVSIFGGSPALRDWNVLGDAAASIVRRYWTGHW